MRRYRIRRLVRTPGAAGTQPPAAGPKDGAVGSPEFDEEGTPLPPPEEIHSFNRGCLGCTGAFAFLVLVMLLSLVVGRCIR